MFNCCGVSLTSTRFDLMHPGVGGLIPESSFADHRLRGHQPSADIILHRNGQFALHAGCPTALLLSMCMETLEPTTLPGNRRISRSSAPGPALSGLRHEADLPCGWCIFPSFEKLPCFSALHRLLVPVYKGRCSSVSRLAMPIIRQAR